MFFYTIRDQWVTGAFINKVANATYYSSGIGDAMAEQPASKTLVLVESDLDDTKLKILRLLASGLERKQIAYELNLHPNSISYHLKKARKALKARNDTQAVVIAIENGLILP